jgi:hypothetical protein
MYEVRVASNTDTETKFHETGQTGSKFENGGHSTSWAYLLFFKEESMLKKKDVDLCYT